MEEDHLKDCVEDLGAADDLPEPEGYTEPKEAEPGEKADREAAATPVSLRCEELVQKNVELFVTAWKQELIQETELKQHVRAWEDTIQPCSRSRRSMCPLTSTPVGTRSRGSANSTSGVPLQS